MTTEGNPASNSMSGLIHSLNQGGAKEEENNAAKIAKEAYHSGISLKEAAIKLNMLDGAEFDRLIDLKKMIG